MNRVTPEQKSGNQNNRILLDLKARQQAGEHMPCPRCGMDTMKPALHTNALSRHADLWLRLRRKRLSLVMVWTSHWG